MNIGKLWLAGYELASQSVGVWSAYRHSKLLLVLSVGASRPSST